MEHLLVLFLFGVISLVFLRIRRGSYKRSLIRSKQGLCGKCGRAFLSGDEIYVRSRERLKFPAITADGIYFMSCDYHWLLRKEVFPFSVSNDIRSANLNHDILDEIATNKGIIFCMSCGKGTTIDSTLLILDIIAASVLMASVVVIAALIIFSFIYG
jgi:hypothetical protein